MQSEYIDKFFTEGKIVVHESTPKESKKIFNSIVRTLHLEHTEFVEKCTSKKILKIDNANLVIELVL